MRTALLACGAVICCCAVLAWQPGAAHAKSAGLDGTERKVVKLVNRIRARHGLKRLKASRALARAASDHTGDILRTDVLTHCSTDRTPIPTRAARSPGGRCATTAAPWCARCSRGLPSPCAIHWT